MTLQGTNQYHFYPEGYLVQGATSTVSLDCALGTQSNEGPATWSPVLSTLIQNLPATGFSLTGSTTVKMNSPMQPLSAIFGGESAVIDVKIAWDIEPGLDVPPEAVVQKTSALQNWRSTAGLGAAAAKASPWWRNSRRPAGVPRTRSRPSLALMSDGSKLVGHLEGDTAQEDIRLPLRSEQSLIADVWKQNHGVAGMADINDNESDPAGDGPVGGAGYYFLCRHRDFHRPRQQQRRRGHDQRRSGGAVRGG
jgi:hypothetical protein